MLVRLSDAVEELSGKVRYPESTSLCKGRE
jgi:hypothetical protein